MASAIAQPAPDNAQEAAPAAAAAAPAAPKPKTRFDIDEFEIRGAEALKQLDVEEAVYPFLGPNKTAEDVEKARTALEKAYHDRGLQTVSVSVPEQDPERRVIVLRVVEQKVGQLKVNGSRFYDTREIKRRARSVAEGKLPNFNDISKDIVALNQWPDRRVTPALRAGVTPGTVDIDLNVEDKLPLHASLEVNNRRSPDTTPTRLIATARYDNLWQAGHSLSLSYQISPQAREEVKVLSGSYLWRHPDKDWFSFLIYGVDTKSNVATVGGTNVVGPGQIVGARAVITLPGMDGFFHTVSAGFDYKDFDQKVTLGTDSFSTPVTYYPISINYNATVQGEGFQTQFGAGVVHGLRAYGSRWEDFDAKRYKANPSFTVLKADLTHTHDLPEGFQLYGKVQGQVSDGPLLSSEQFSLGGLDTVRGYLESEVVGDYGATGTVEVRSPDLASWFKLAPPEPSNTYQIPFINEWRLFAFADRGVVKIHDALADQTGRFDLGSYGVGTRFRAFEYLNGNIVYAVPLIDQTSTKVNERRVLFRIWGEF